MASGAPSEDSTILPGGTGAPTSSRIRASASQRPVILGEGQKDMVPQGALDERCINTIRTLAMDAVQQADSGHPGTPMALAPVIYTLWQRFLRFDPEDPIWPNRDRFVLSNGHASMLLYAILISPA